MTDKPDSNRQKTLRREGRTTEGSIPCPEPKCSGLLSYKSEPRVYVCRKCGVEQPELHTRISVVQHKQGRKKTEKDLDKQFLENFFGKPKKKGKWDDLIEASKKYNKD